MTNYCFTPEECNHYGSQLWPLLMDGTLKIRVHKEYPFTAEGVKEAQQDLVSGKTSGKLIVDLSKTS